MMDPRQRHIATQHAKDMLKAWVGFVLYVGVLAYIPPSVLENPTGAINMAMMGFFINLALLYHFAAYCDIAYDIRGRITGRVPW